MFVHPAKAFLVKTSPIYLSHPSSAPNSSTPTLPPHTNLVEKNQVLLFTIAKMSKLFIGYVFCLLTSSGLSLSTYLSVHLSIWVDGFRWMTRCCFNVRTIT
ncbi:hypothetical protein TWF132_007685 [Orbilia oligospora]|nr:hypothetical protein TWF132_007685 [Orbilia oligospora]